MEENQMWQQREKLFKAQTSFIKTGLLLLALGLLAVVVGRAAWAATLIKVDGSSTVYPITEAVAEEFQKKNPKVRVTVGISGTGGGFKKFCNGETDMSDASRPIKLSEVGLCRDNKIGYVELPVAYDGLAVMVNLKNDWAGSMTVKELKKLWEPAAQGKITRWSQIRPGWPDKEIHLFGPGVDSGTYDYFTEAIVGKEHSSRGDYTASEDDNVLVQGIATDSLALGFFGLAYYEHNQDKLKLVAIDDENPKNGNGPITPSFETVINGTYQPLARPIFIYVSTKAVNRPEVKEFVQFYLTAGRPLVREVGYIPLADKVYDLALNRFEKQTVGSVFSGKGSQAGVTLESLLTTEAK
jgi:phosphate transport system substrate-binding protein